VPFTTKRLERFYNWISHISLYILCRWANQLEIKKEIKSANFYLESEYSGTLIHNSKDPEKGQVMNFKKGNIKRGGNNG